MGQYYKATFLDKNADVTANDWNPIKFQLSPYDFNNGAKLMEHSWVDDSYVQAVEYLLSKDKEGTRFAWCGDYAENFNGLECNLYDFGDDDACREGLSQLFKDGVVQFHTEQGWSEEWCELKNPKTYKYILNHSKKLYVVIPKQNEHYTVIHPLPLLTCESNGLGGGDYFSKKDGELVGSWKYDRISVGDEIPSGFKELKVNFKE